MNSAQPIGHSEGQSNTLSSLFNGSHFIWWKAMIEIYLYREGYELWYRIIYGPTIPMKIVDGEQVKKLEENSLLRI